MKNKNNNNKQKEKNQNRNCPSAKEVNEKEMFSRQEDCPKDELENQMVDALIEKNTVAILMPYLRSELTLLTAQPDTDSVVLPPFNINKMLEEA